MLVAAYAFETLNLNKLRSCVVAFNNRAFVDEGAQREQAFIHAATTRCTGDAPRFQASWIAPAIGSEEISAPKLKRQSR
jgi:hypothetical protein